MQRAGGGPARQMLGRELEAAAVARFLDGGGVAPTALVVEGEAGVGKTTLIRTALRQVDAAGLRAWVAHPSQGEQELPYCALGDLLAGCREGAFTAVAGPQRTAIDVALGRGVPAGLDEHALLRGLLEVLRVEAADGQLLLVVDDAQWLDRPTAAALAFVLRRIAPVPVRVLVAVRTGPGAPAAVPLGLSEWANVDRVAIGPLSATDIGVMVARDLGLRLARPRLEDLARVSGGNPMLALELARQGNTDSSRLFTAVTSRIRALPVPARSVVDLAAVALRPSTELLIRAGAVTADLRLAVDAGMIELDAGRVSFAHPMLAEAAYALLPAPERQRLHGQLARVSSDVVERGHHIARCAVGPDPAAATMLEQAAAEASGLGDHAGAAAFLHRAAEISMAGPAADARAVRAAAELWLAGDVDTAAARSRGLIDRLGPGLARARARQTLVMCGIGSTMSYADALAELAAALGDAQGDDPVAAELLVLSCEAALAMCRLDDAVGHARRATATAERAAVPAVGTQALALLGFAESMLGLGVTDAARQACARWDGSLSPVVSPRMLLGCACIPALALDEAEELFGQEIAWAQEQGWEPVEVIARAHLAEAQVRAGRWADALASARLAVEHARQAADAQIINGVCYPLAMTEALLGRHDEARAIATDALAGAEATLDFWFTISHRAVIGLVALTEGQPRLAIEVLEPAWASMLDNGLGDLSLFPVGHVLGEALVASRRPSDALSIVDALRASPVGNLPWSQGMAARLQALVESARGDHDAARAAIAYAIRAHAELPEPFEFARTVEVAGRVNRAARNWGAARSAFVDAHDRFATLGAARWVDRTVAEISRLPGRRPADGRALTARERDVAELASAGLSNKEIAARLFVSVATVEAKLSAVYAKFGVRSRTQLARRLDQEPTS